MIYPFNCSECKKEFSKEFKNRFPNGLPVPIICDKCKAINKADLTRKENLDKLEKAKVKIPNVYRKWVNLDKIESTRNWLNDKTNWAYIIFGESDTEKTTKAWNSFVNYYVLHNSFPEFWSARELSKSLCVYKSGITLMYKLSNCNLLIIDDLMTEDNEAKYKNAIEELLSNREVYNRKTIMTTNATEKDLYDPLKGYGARMESRFNRAIFSTSRSGGHRKQTGVKK